MTAAVAAPPPALDAPRRTIPAWVFGALGVVGLLVLWEVLALTVFTKDTVPTPIAILQQLHADGWSIYWDNLSATLAEAAKGWLWGNAFAIVLAVLFVQVPFLERGLMKFAVALYCLPVVAIGPILAVLYTGDTPMVVLAALSVFFATLISMLVGLKSADPVSLDLVHAYGGGSLSKLRKVRLTGSLPMLFSGLRVAAPAAVLGAVIGEYIGGTKGMGVFMVASETHLDVARTWGIALVVAAVSGIGYGLTVLAEYLLVPWARRTSR